MSERVVTTYERVDYGVTRRGVCPVCGGKVSRSTTFSATINPFNRNADGTVRNRVDIRRELARQADAWVPDFRHRYCRDS